MINMEKTEFKNQSSSDLLFRPLTEGLGFHPFSDGLPYAPVGRGQRPKSEISNQTAIGTGGSGAIAAGVPIPVRPTNSVSKLGLKNPEIPQIPRISVPVAQLKRPSPTLASAEVEDSSLNVMSEFGYTYLSKRIMAYFLDGVISATICLSVVGFLAWIQDLSIESLNETEILLGITLFICVFHWALITMQEVLLKTTLCKRLFGLNFRASSMTLFLRALFFFPSVFFLGMGLIWGLFDPKSGAYMISYQAFNLSN